MRPSPALMVRMTRGIVINTLIFALLLFVPAGTVHWWRAWALIGVVIACTAWTVFSVLLRDEELLRERMASPIQRGQPLSDKALVLVLIISFLAAMLFVPLDVFRFHVFGKPPLAISAVGLGLVVVGWGVISFTLKANSFAALVVKDQESRGQRVIDTGPYRFVRHPMYAGTALYLIGISLWLESSAGVLVALIPTGVLAVRILFEERYLRRHLDGYDAYTAKVRWRLIPFVW